MISTFSIEKPAAFLLILAFIPVIICVFHRFRKIAFALGGFYGNEDKLKIYSQIKKRLLLRTFFRLFAWIFAVSTLAGISWGTKTVSVPGNGKSVCFVFDISYSMMAKDCDGISRLEAVKSYASSLVSRIDGTSFSAVLAKGDGFSAIPETEDREAMYALIENLNPSMISSAGSSIGKGILAALHSISLNSARTNFIWVFTDCEETDGQLENALVESGKYGVPVTFIGFGKETETEITAGDGKNRVQTSLKSKKLQETMEKASEKTKRLSLSKNSGSGLTNYIDSTAPGSAIKLLNQTRHSADEKGVQATFSSEIIPIKRHKFFLLLSILFFMLSFVAGELKIQSARFRKMLSGSILCLLFLTSCHKEQKDILKGSWNWYQGEFNSATAQFLNTTIKTQENTLAHQFSLFGLASTYISLEQYDSAMERLQQIQTGSSYVTPELGSAVFYNAGIICQRKNDFSQAAEYFKKAILADSGNLNARINLELCNRHNEEKNARQSESEMQKTSEDRDNSSMQNQIFNLIREQDSKQWKKLQSNQKESKELDY